LGVPIKENFREDLKRTLFEKTRDQTCRKDLKGEKKLIVRKKKGRPCEKKKRYLRERVRTKGREKCEKKIKKTGVYRKITWGLEQIYEKERILEDGGVGQKGGSAKKKEKKT